MRARPARVKRLPEQYFGALLARVSAAAADGGEPLIDLGRGNPETGPPPHVVEALTRSVARSDVHGYSPFRGLPELREALAERYRTRYGVELDPISEVAVVPGTKTAIVELCLVLAEEGETVVLPDPYYPDYPSGPALAGARQGLLPLIPADGWAPDFSRAPTEGVAAVYLNFPSNPCAVAVPPGTFEEAVGYAQGTGAAVVHDFAYGDLVFDGRQPQSFLATPGAKEVGVEMFSMSKSYGMAGWRVGFVVGNAEIVERGTCSTITAASGSSGRSRRRASPRWRGRRTRSPRGATHTSAGATASSKCSGRRPARAPSTSGSSCPRGLRPTISSRSTESRSHRAKASG